MSATLASSPSMAGDAERLLAVQRAAFDAERDPPLAVRRHRLDRLLALAERHEDEIVAAIAAAGSSSSSGSLAGLSGIDAGPAPAA